MREFYVLLCVLALLAVCLTLPTEDRTEEGFGHGQVAADIPCIKGANNGLTDRDLKKWLLSVTGELNSTFITPDNGVTMYRGSSIEKAYSTFISNGTKPKKILVNNSPCPACVPSLMNKFKSPFPVFISCVSFNGSQKELECLAKMVYKKFTVAKMDWAAFSKKLTDKKCVELITQNINMPQFKEAQQKLDEQISDIISMSKEPDVAQYCT